MSFRIVMMTSNNYLNIASFSIDMLNKYWRNHPPIDVVHHELYINNKLQVKEFNAGPQSTTSWVEALLNYLEINTDELILLTLDDYAMCAPVKENMISRAYELISNDLSISVFYLTWMYLPKYNKYYGLDDIVIYPAWEWSCHTQAGIWRRSNLVNLLNMIQSGSIDDFEKRGSIICNTNLRSEKRCGFRIINQIISNNPLLLDSNDKSEWPIPYHNLMHRGSIDMKHIEYLLANNYNLSN